MGTASDLETPTSLMFHRESGSQELCQLPNPSTPIRRKFNRKVLAAITLYPICDDPVRIGTMSF